VKPYGLLDVAGFYEPLLIFLRRLVQEGFVRADHHDMLLVDTVPQYLLERMATHRTPAMPKWVDRAST
jgi:predicted Rossmann-fold nucleotide-binding protein